MSRSHLLVLLALLALLPATPLGAQDEPERPAERRALVIGIDGYTALPKLKTAGNDARAVAALLEQGYGFRVELLLDASRGEILGSLAKLRRTLRRQDDLLIYYAGHGWRDPESHEGYWLPVDATKADPSNWVSNADISTALKVLPAHHVMVVADSCYSGALTRGLTMRVKGTQRLEQLRSKRARVVLTSGGLEPVEDNEGGEHSVFAQEFLRALEENQAHLDGEALYQRIRRPVELNAAQKPSFGDIRFTGHEQGGDFVFARPGSKPTAAPPAADPAQPPPPPPPPVQPAPQGPVQVLERSPGKLVLKATGKSTRGAPGSLMRMNWSKRKAISLIKDAALQALQAAPYRLTEPQAAALLQKKPKETFEILDDGVAVTWTVAVE